MEINAPLPFYVLIYICPQILASIMYEYSWEIAYSIFPAATLLTQPWSTEGSSAKNVVVPL
jgi:hypothetical protein